MADSLVAGFRAKYTFDHWRPVTVIRGSGNSASEPLLVTPPHPEYPSAHCLGAGAAVAVLRDFLGKDQFSAAFVYPPLGVLARWETLSQLATEVENARIWSGIHFRTSVEHGTKIGLAVGEFTVRNALKPRG